MTETDSQTADPERTVPSVCTVRLWRRVDDARRVALRLEDDAGASVVEVDRAWRVVEVAEDAYDRALGLL